MPDWEAATSTSSTLGSQSADRYGPLADAKASNMAGIDARGDVQIDMYR
jgi:hypothetical protein